MKSESMLLNIVQQLKIHFFFKFQGAVAITIQLNECKHCWITDLGMICSNSCKKVFCFCFCFFNPFHRNTIFSSHYSHSSYSSLSCALIFSITQSFKITHTQKKKLKKEEKKKKHQYHKQHILLSWQNYLICTNNNKNYLCVTINQSI